MGNIVSDIAGGLGDAGTFINRIWVDWKIGPVMAFLSMIMVFTRDYGLIKDFIRSESRLRKWPRLALYTAARVCMSVAAYHGPVWVLEWIVWFFEFVFGLLVRLYDFLAGFDQAFIMHGTTAVILITFIAVTAWAVKCWVVDRFAGLKSGGTPGMDGTPEPGYPDEPDYPGATCPVYLDDMEDGQDAPGIDDWDNAKEKKYLWRHMKLRSRLEILVRDFRTLFARRPKKSGYVHDSEPDVTGSVPGPKKIPVKIGRKAGGKS